jgi:hypothetical protein
MADFFVLYFNTQSGRYEAVGRIDGVPDGAAANGTAAINQGRSGKYAAFDVAAAAVDDIIVEPSATLTPSTF